MPGFLVSLCLFLYGWFWTFPAISAPINDDFSKAQVLSGFAGHVEGSNVGATYQKDEPSHAGQGTTNSIWYRWIAPQNTHVQFTTEGTSIDTVLAVYTNTSKSIRTLQPVASNDDAHQGVSWSTARFDAAMNVEYWIAVDGISGAQGEVELTWATQPHNDAFSDFQMLSSYTGTVTGDLTGATLDPGENPLTQFSDLATNTVWFAWAPLVPGEVTIDTLGSQVDTVITVYNGSDLDSLVYVASDDNSGGNNGESRVTFNASPGDRFRIVVASIDGSGGAYQLNWLQDVPPPANDYFSAATPVSGIAGESLGINVGAALEIDEPHHAANASDKSVWLQWTAPRNGEVRFSAADSLFNAIITVYTGNSIETIVPVASSRATDGTPSSTFTFSAISDTPYSIAIDGVNGESGVYILKWIYTDQNSPYNQFTNALPIGGFVGQVISENYYADVESGEPTHAGDPGGKSIWFKWKAPGNFHVRFETVGSNFDTLLAVYVGESLENGLTSIISNDDQDTITTSRVSFDAIAGTVYRIAVDGSSQRGTEAPALGMVVLTWSIDDVSPVVFSPGSGMIGSRIDIGVNNYTNAISVQVGGASCVFAAVQGSLVTQIPAGAVTGPVIVTSQDGSVWTSTSDFTVTQSIPPTLSLRTISGGILQVVWGVDHDAFHLECKDELEDDDAWHVCTPVDLVGTEFIFETRIRPGRSALFYRLVMP